MYGSNRYGHTAYAAGSSNPDNPEEYYQDLMQYVPSFVAEKKEMYELYRSQGYETGWIRHELESLIDQCLIQTSTYGLLRWERVFGINTNLALSYEQRREILCAKIRGQGTTTRQMIIDAAAAFSGGEVDVIEDNEHYRFIVRFIGIKGIPRNTHAFISMLEDIKPAHLAYTFEYRYTVWSEMLPYTWDSLKENTWDGLRILKEDN